MVPSNKIIASVLALCGASASAECYYKSVTLNQFRERIERTADVQREVKRLYGQVSCTVTFRVMIAGQWHTAQGTANNAGSANVDQLCAQAQDYGNSQILQEAAGSTASMHQELICTDQEIPKWRPVKKHETVKESQVAPHWDLAKRQSFQHKGTECRWFTETVPMGQGGLVQSEGVICRINREQWYVAEKWIHSIDK